MKIQSVLKVFAIVLMAVVLLVLASWVSTVWTKGLDFLGGLLPTGNEPIAQALRGYLPTVKSVGGHHRFGRCRPPRLVLWPPYLDGLGPARTFPQKGSGVKRPAKP